MIVGPDGKPQAIENVQQLLNRQNLGESGQSDE